MCLLLMASTIWAIGKSLITKGTIVRSQSTVQNQMILQRLRPLKARITKFTFEALQVTMNDHVHLQCPLRVQRDTADIADVLSHPMRVLMSLKPRLVLESLITEGAGKRKLIWVDDLMFLEGAFCAEILAASRAQEWPLLRMNRLHMRLNIDRFREFLRTTLNRTWMNELFIVRKVWLLVNPQLSLAIESFAALWALKGLFDLRMAFFHVILKGLLVCVDLVA